MKAGIFTLTKSEQRVVILIVLALLIAAFVRYWREVSAHPTTNPTDPSHATAAPFSSPVDEEQMNPDEEAANAGSKIDQRPSPQSSP